MTIRLNKVTRDLNVGIQTAVDFLQKKGFSIESNPNTKISDEQRSEERRVGKECRSRWSPYH